MRKHSVAEIRIKSFLRMKNSFRVRSKVVGKREGRRTPAKPVRSESVFISQYWAGSLPNQLLGAVKDNGEHNLLPVMMNVKKR